MQLADQPIRYTNVMSRILKETTDIVRPYRIPSFIPVNHCTCFRHMQIQWNAKCGLGYGNPLPSEKELSQFYLTDYRQIMRKNQSFENYLNSPNYRAQVRSQISWVKALVGNTGKWLDIGAGYGLLLYQVSKVLQKWKLYAIEPDIEARDSLENVECIEADIESLWSKETPLVNQYDVVSISHVLEHLKDPWLVLHNLKQYIKVGGLLLLEVPNDQLSEILRPGRSSDLPHLWFFSQEGLESLVQDMGFRILRSAQLGLRRPESFIPFSLRIRRFMHRIMRGPLAILDDPTWYAEGKGRCDIRILCQLTEEQ